MIFELWSTETDMLLGTLDVPQHVSEEIGERVIIKTKGFLETHDGELYNAIEVQVCKMKINDVEYWALETNLPRIFIHRLEGFAPKLERPSMAQIHYLSRNADG
jgi:hypothetical protein